MNQVFTVYSGFFLAASAVSFIVAVLARQRRSVRGAKDLTLLMLASGIWSFFIIFETAAPTVELKVFWAKFGYLGAVTTPVLYLIFVMRFTGNEKFITRNNVILLCIVPLITMVLAITNGMHHLLWSGFSTIYPKTNMMEYFHGIWFWVGYMAYNNILLLLATIYLFSFVIRRHDTFRSQGWIIFVASLCPWISSVVYLTGANPVPGLDLVPVSNILSGVLLVYAILYFRFLDLVPIARVTLVETLPDGIIVLDKQNRIQDINASALNFLGIESKSIIGAQVELAGARDVKLLDEVISQTSANNIEVKSSQHGKTFRVTRQGIKIQAGSRLVVIRDITDLVVNQNKIRNAEERYRSMFTMFRLMADNMPDMLWAKDLEKKFVFTNKAVCDNLIRAINTDEPIGKDDLFFALRERQKHPDNPDWFTFGELCQDSDQVVLNSGKVEHFYEYGNVGGEFLYLDVWKAPIFNNDGMMIGVVGSGRDVTHQKRTEEEIYQKDRLLDAIAKATALLIQTENLDESINNALEIIGKATRVNRVYIFQNHNDTGYKMPLMSQCYEWCDGSVDPQIDNPDLQNLPYEIACPRWFETLSAGKVIVGNIADFPEPEKTSLSAQGIKSILATPVIIDKNFWGFIGFDDCTTERDWPSALEQILTAAANTIGVAYLRKRSQEELLVSKEKAEESDRLKSAFLANMSHEIRTPMNGILGFAELLKEPDLTGAEQKKYISIIEKSGTRMLSIINDLVDLAKIESGQMELAVVETNINEQIDYLFSFFKPEVESRGIRFSVNKGLSLVEAYIKTDKEKIYAILTNLVKNAIKFTQVGFIEFGYVKNDRYLEFYIKDSGIGIAEDRQEAIFNRFVQGNITNRQARQGAGLGLSIAKAYVLMLGGEIWVKSQEGKGSAFHFTIPYVAGTL